MKKACLLLACALVALSLQAQVVISPNNPANPHASAMLDVQSTDKGMLIPRMTTAQRTAITNPAKGLLVFDTNTNTFWFYNGSAWGPVDGNTVPSTGIILSEVPNNANLTAGGFSLQGKLRINYTPVNGNPSSYDWSGGTSLVNAPAPRYGHTAVWTGTEMIVWGGDTLLSVRCNTGAKYNPVTDTWIATPSDNAPSSRRGHTSIWTGTEMIVWGGWDSTGYTNSGSKYNLASNTWTPIAMNNAPTGRIGHTAIWTGTEMIVWGGLDNNGNYANTGAKYNPTSDTWETISTTNTPIGRTGHTAVWTGSEMIIWGGGTNPNIYFNTGAKYNPVLNTWISISTALAPSERSLQTAIWTGSEMIIWGGRGSGNVYFNTGAKYNPASNTWSPTSTIASPSERINHTAVWSGSEMIVWGGRVGGSSPTNSGGRYSPSNDVWSSITQPLPLWSSNKASHVAVWTGLEMVVWGGWNTDGLTNTGDTCFPIQNKNFYLFQKN